MDEVVGVVKLVIKRQPAYSIRASDPRRRTHRLMVWPSAPLYSWSHCELDSHTTGDS
jgi:hypothetical protein